MYKKPRSAPQKKRPNEFTAYKSSDQAGDHIDGTYTKVDLRFCQMKTVQGKGKENKRDCC